MNPVVHNLDVDDIVERVDVNALLDRVDLDGLIEKIDLNRVLDRVDVDRILDRVDVDKVIDRSNLGEIVARSTSGVLTHLLDAVRTQTIRADQAVQGWGRLSCFRALCGIGAPRNLPPKPHGFCSKTKEQLSQPCPSRTSKLALAVQGRSAGFISRSLAFVIDQCIVVGSYTVFALFVVFVMGLILERLEQEIRDIITQWEGWAPLAALVLVGWKILYDFCSLAAVGRTIGKALLGLLVVTANGKRLPVQQALLRSLATSIPVIVVMLSWLGLLRKDRRQVQDLICCTTVVYAWDTRQFQLRERGCTEAEQMEPFYDSMIDRSV